MLGMFGSKKAEEGIQQDIKAYRALNSINKSKEFDEFFDLILKTAANKMIWTFTAENVKNWEDFCKVRGEVASYLYPIQEVRGAGEMAKRLKEQLDEYYKNPIDTY